MTIFTQYVLSFWQLRTSAMIAFLIDTSIHISVQATDKDWVQLQGKFLLNGIASKVVIYLEGPPAGTDILLNSLVVKHASKVPPSPPPNNEVRRITFFTI